MLNVSIVHLVGPVAIYSINNCLGTVRGTQFCAGRSDFSSCQDTAQLTEVSGQNIVVLVQVHCKCTVGFKLQTDIQRRKIKETPCSTEYNTVFTAERNYGLSPQHRIA